MLSKRWGGPLPLFSSTRKRWLIRRNPPVFNFSKIRVEMKPTDSNSKVRCSLCGKEARDVRKLIAGPKVHICDECVSLCREIIEEDRTREPEKSKALEEMRPSQIKAYLDEHIIGQDHGKRTISVAVYNHYKRLKAAEAERALRAAAAEEAPGEELVGFDDEDEDEVELTKGNILMIGPT